MNWVGIMMMVLGFACFSLLTYCIISYFIFTQAIESEDKELNFDGKYGKTLYKFGAYHCINPAVVFPILRESKYHRTQNIIKKHNFAAKLFWLTIIGLLIIPLIGFLTNSL
jgi:magnesium-transporting ATPase (P-type)